MTSHTVWDIRQSDVLIEKSLDGKHWLVRLTFGDGQIDLEFASAETLADFCSRFEAVIPAHSIPF